MRYTRFFSLLALILAVLLISVSCADTDGGGEETKAEKYYTVKFSTVGGTQVEGMTLKEGSYIPEPEIPEKSGYIFDGWKDADGKWRFDTDKVTTNVSLTAVWIAEKTVFEYEVNNDEVTITGQGLPACVNASVSCSAAATLPCSSSAASDARLMPAR